MSLSNRINKDIQQLEIKGRVRSLGRRDTLRDALRYASSAPIAQLLDLSSNDYLGLASDDSLTLSLKDQKYVGSSASRVLCPRLLEHEALETALAAITQQEAALLFGSGYLANIGTLSALINRNDIVISDKLIHASLIDGITLSRATHYRTNHNDLSHFEERLQHSTKNRSEGKEVFIVTESVFSMDGDLAPLKELLMLAKTYDATLIVDEAHAIGVFGKEGGGLFSELFEEGLGDDAQRVVLLGTLSKSLASYGGFVSAKKEIIQYLISSARSFLFSTALPEVVVQSALSALNLLKQHPEWRKEVLNKSQIFASALRAQGLKVGETYSNIIPIITGDEAVTILIQERLAEQGIIVAGIRPPTVPPRTSRLRCSISRKHTEEELIIAAEKIVKAVFYYCK